MEWIWNFTRDSRPVEYKDFEDLIRSGKVIRTKHIQTSQFAKNVDKVGVESVEETRYVEKRVDGKLSKCSMLKHCGVNSMYIWKCLPVFINSNINYDITKLLNKVETHYIFNTHEEMMNTLGETDILDVL